MHYSLRDKINLKIAFYIVAALLIIGLFSLGVAGRKSTVDETDNQQINVTIAPTKEPKSNNKISVFDHDANEVLYMDIEDYVIGAVSKEMPASFSNEALKAQAVAARTIAYKHINQKQGCNDCDTCTSPAHVQGYASLEDRKLLWGDEFDKWEKIIEDAVMDTAAEVMVYDGELIDVLYHASSNGQTEDSVDVFSGSREYLISVTSPDENLVIDELVLSKADFASKVNKAYSGANLSADNLKDQIRILSYTPSGRVENVALGSVKIDGVSFRKLFSIKSTDFSFVFMDNNIIISTSGYGHGVGMSQRGANEMAKKGYSYGDILTHYYTGVSVTNIIN